MRPAHASSVHSLHGLGGQAQIAAFEIVLADFCDDLLLPVPQHPHAGPHIVSPADGKPDAALGVFHVARGEIAGIAIFRLGPYLADHLLRFYGKAVFVDLMNSADNLHQLSQLAWMRDFHLVHLFRALKHIFNFAIGIQQRVECVHHGQIGRAVGGVSVFVEMGSHEQHGQSDGFRRVCVKIHPAEIIGRSLCLME
nr:MAG TPA: hypothetical protein [Caudoviricetes sp.]